MTASRIGGIRTHTNTSVTRKVPPASWIHFTSRVVNKAETRSRNQVKARTPYRPTRATPFVYHENMRHARLNLLGTLYTTDIESYYS